MKIKPILTAACAAALVFSAAACQTQTVSSSKADTSELSAADTTVAQTTVEPTTTAPERHVEDYVITAKEYQIDYSGAFLLTGEESRSSETATARFPQLLQNAPDADAMNAELHERFDRTFDEYNNSTYVSGRTDYVASLNNRILSLAVESRSVDTPNSDFWVYTADVDTGKRLTRDEIAAIAGTTTQDVLNEVIDDINARCDNTTFSGDMLEQLDKVRIRSLEQENLDKAEFFFDSDGVLNVTYGYYWVAGAERYGALLKTSFVCQ